MNPSDPFGLSGSESNLLRYRAAPLLGFLAPSAQMLHESFLRRDSARASSRRQPALPACCLSVFRVSTLLTAFSSCSLASLFRLARALGVPILEAVSFASGSCLTLTPGPKGRGRKVPPGRRRRLAFPQTSLTLFPRHLCPMLRVSPCPGLPYVAISHDVRSTLARSKLARPWSPSHAAGLHTSPVALQPGQCPPDACASGVRRRDSGEVRRRE